MKKSQFSARSSPLPPLPGLIEIPCCCVVVLESLEVFMSRTGNMTKFYGQKFAGHSLVIEKASLLAHSPPQNEPICICAENQFGLQLFEVGRILGWPHESVAADPTR